MIILNRRYFGALTNKDYAFKGRPWELQNSIFFDVFDFNGTQLRADFRESTILRVLPKKIPNDNIWITDRARFQYLAYNKLRLKQPNLFLNNKIYTITTVNLSSWFFYVFNNVITTNRKNLLLFFSNIENIQGAVSFAFSNGISIGGKIITKLKNFTGIIGQKLKRRENENDFMYYYDKSKVFVDVQKVLLIGLDLRLWFPQLNYHFRQQTRKGHVIFSFGSRIFYNFQNQHLGSGMKNVKNFLGGQHWHNSNNSKAEPYFFVNRKILELIENKVPNEQLCILENKPFSLAFNSISFVNHMDLCLNRVHLAWTRQRQLFFSMIQPVKKEKLFLNIFFGIHSIQSFMSSFFSTVNVQIPFDSPIEIAETFLAYNGQWIVQNPIYVTKNQLTMLDTFGELSLFWNETFIQIGVQKANLIKKGKISNKYFRFFDHDKFFIDIPTQSAGVLGILEKIRKTKRTKYTKCSL
jgi:hypothetical protein